MAESADQKVSPGTSQTNKMWLTSKWSWWMPYVLNFKMKEKKSIGIHSKKKETKKPQLTSK